jgi:hypothetical protein
MECRNERSFKMKKMIIACLLALPLVAVNTPAARAEFDVYGSVAGYNWRESGAPFGMAKESGPIYGLGVMARLAPPAPNIFTVTARAEGFGGELDYEDLTVIGRSDISGARLEGDLGMKLRLPSLSLEPFAGIGYRWWERRYVFGDEQWQNVYGRIGLRLEQHLPMSPVRIFAEGGAKIPISNRASFDDGFSTVSANPGKRTSAFAEAGVRITTFKISGFYEGMRFGASDNGAFGDIAADIVGVRVGLSFF